MSILAASRSKAALFALSIDSQQLHLSHAAGMHECPDPGPQKRRSSRFYTQEKRSEIPKCPQITALPPWGPPGRTSGRRYGFQLQLAAMTGQLQIVRGAARRGQDAAAGRSWQRGVAGQPMCAAVCPRRPEAPNFSTNEKLSAPIPTPACVHTEYSCSNGHADWFPRSFRGFCRKSPDLRNLRSFF